MCNDKIMLSYILKMILNLNTSLSNLLKLLCYSNMFILNSSIFNSIIN